MTGVYATMRLKLCKKGLGLVCYPAARVHALRQPEARGQAADHRGVEGVARPQGVNHAPCVGHLTAAVYLYMTGLLHEGIFHVRGLIKPAIFGSLPWAYVMWNWAQILIYGRH